MTLEGAEVAARTPGCVLEEHERIADEHDDARCECESCATVRARDRARATAREARVRGGLASCAHELLGGGWLEEGRMQEREREPTTIERLAVRALGDVFEQLERIGAAGRDTCRPLIGAPPPVTRREAVELIRAAENALDYARVHLDYLPRPPATANDNGERYRPGDRVIVHDGDAQHAATIERLGGTADDVIVRYDGGATLQHVDVRDLREVAQ